MNRMKPSCIVLLFLLTCCQDPKESPEKKGTYSKIDLHQYTLPTSDLLQGKVYCYVDSIGAYKRFEYNRETISGQDTFFESIDYDSSFAEKGEEKDQLSREGITPVSVETFQNGISIPTQLNPGLIPWIHPLQSGDSSLHLSFVMKFGSGQATGVMVAGFDSVTVGGLLGSYRAKDCIQENLVFHLDAGAFSMPIHSITKEVYCLCKGVGKVGLTNSYGNKQLLNEIISKNEFDAMKSQH
jgi:hypothetical protein